MSKLWRHKDDHVADCADQTWVPRLLHSLPPLSLYSMQLPSLLSSNAIVSLLYLAFKDTPKNRLKVMHAQYCCLDFRGEMCGCLKYMLQIALTKLGPTFITQFATA